MGEDPPIVCRMIFLEVIFHGRIPPNAQKISHEATKMITHKMIAKNFRGWIEKTKRKRKNTICSMSIKTNDQPLRRRKLPILNKRA